MKWALTLVLLMAAACSEAQTTVQDTESECIDLAEQGDVSVSGRLTVQLFAGPPNYESIAAGDQEERAFILELPRRICVTDEEGFADPNEMFDRVHISADEALLPVLQSAVGYDVTVSGGGMGAHTGHHHAPLVIMVNEITVR